MYVLFIKFQVYYSHVHLAYLSIWSFDTRSYLESFCKVARVQNVKNAVYRQKFHRLTVNLRYSCYYKSDNIFLDTSKYAALPLRQFSTPNFDCYSHSRRLCSDVTENERRKLRERTAKFRSSSRRWSRSRRVDRGKKAGKYRRLSAEFRTSDNDAGIPISRNETPRFLRYGGRYVASHANACLSVRYP